MSKESRQAGFVGIVVALAIVVIVIAVGGYILYQHYSSKPLASSSTTNPQSSPQKATTTGQPAQTATQYLDIKEWGIELPLPDSIKDAYYVVPTGMSNDPDGLPSGIILGVKSLDASCGVVAADPKGYNNLLGGIVRVPPADKDPVSGKLYTEEDPNGVTIGDYYYGFADAVLKSKTCISQTTLQSVDSSFAGAVKGAAKAATAQ